MGSSLTSKTIRSKPAARILAAMGLPILPNPTNPTVKLICCVAQSWLIRDYINGMQSAQSCGFINSERGAILSEAFAGLAREAEVEDSFWRNRLRKLDALSGHGDHLSL